MRIYRGYIGSVLGPFRRFLSVLGSGSTFWGPGVVPMRPDQNSVRFPATNASNRAMATQLSLFFAVFVCVFAGWGTISYVLRVPARWGTISCVLRVPARWGTIPYVLRVPGEYVGICRNM